MNDILEHSIRLLTPTYLVLANGHLAPAVEIRYLAPFILVLAL